MKNKLFLLFSLLSLCSGILRAQQAYWVFFTDKNGTTFDPYSYFAPEAITRRLVNHVSLYDSTDFPVNGSYLAEVAKHVDTLGHATRWFNGVGVVAEDYQVNELRRLPFVREVVPQQTFSWMPASNPVPDTTLDDFDDNTRNVAMQIDPMQGKQFADNGKTGNGIIIAILDAGFKDADKHPAFENVRFNNRIRSTYDFVKNSDDVYSTRADHGTMVLSCICGTVAGTNMGLAPDATFLLARIAKEYGNEHRGEENFLAAVEWADARGAMIINCSGGPGSSAYLPEQMNGKVALISRAANLAARKGILVVAAAGNDGENRIQTNLLPPSEADSALSVTALNDSGYIASYSSRGPTVEFKHKPDVCAPGTAIVADGTGEFTVAEGTSFSAPLLAGFAACLMQLYPDIQVMQLLDTMRHCGSLYPYYDYAHGYGVPQASHFFHPAIRLVPTFSILRKGNSASIVLDSAFKPECCDRTPSLLFYNLETADGKIYKYEVVLMRDLNPFEIPDDQLKAGIKINAFYRGYYASMQF